MRQVWQVNQRNRIERATLQDLQQIAGRAHLTASILRFTKAFTIALKFSHANNGEKQLDKHR